MTVTALADAVGAADRLAAVRATGLLDAPAEETFDRVTRLARRVLGAPVVLLKLIDARRDFIMSGVGLPEPLATAREIRVAPSRWSSWPRGARSASRRCCGGRTRSAAWCRSCRSAVGCWRPHAASSPVGRPPCRPNVCR